LVVTPRLTEDEKMEPILARCGYRCDLCLAYRPNITENPSDRQRLSDGCHKYFGFRLPPSDVCCDGCMAEDQRLIDKSCPVRPCVIEKGLGNCSQCDEYACERLKERSVVYEDVKNRVGAEIPQEDRTSFILPYENKQRLDSLRAAGRKR
jgi:hypothetical protein